MDFGERGNRQPRIAERPFFDQPVLSCGQDSGGWIGCCELAAAMDCFGVIMACLSATHQACSFEALTVAALGIAEFV